MISSDLKKFIENSPRLNLMFTAVLEEYGKIILVRFSPYAPYVFR
jgi:hypothetical protein